MDIASALLVVWIGFGRTQALDIERFDNMGECFEAKMALMVYDSRLKGDCIPVDPTPPQDTN